jgi:periplasmic divalent cation tolerance protein
MTEFVQVITTTETRDQADHIAQHLVERRLAGCVQVIGPLTSTYRWQGAVETTDEWLCLIKTAQALYPQVEAAILEIHPYETPEILAAPISAGSSDYLGWLSASLKPND